MLAEADDCRVLIVDCQDKLVPHVSEGEQVVAQ